MISPGANDVAIWLIDLARIGLEPMRALLSADERARADQYRQQGDIERFVKGRGALRRILGERTGQDAHSLAFTEGGGRKPSLRNHPAIAFNLSHSGGYVLIALGDTPVGVDIETMRPIDWAGMGETVFHPDERAAMAASADPHSAFFQLWTHKEAFLKATGIGLTDRLTEINVALAGGRIAAPREISTDDWYATPLDAPDGYKASLVTRQARPHLRNLTADFSG